MKKIKEIIVGTNNNGKYKEICDLLPNEIKKYSPKEFKISSPKENGKSFAENSMIKASYFSKKTNLVCLSDDSGLEIELLKGAPGIYSARWGGIKNNFDEAIQKVFKEMSKIKKDWKRKNAAKFICCMTLFWPDGLNYSSTGVVKGKISAEKRGNNGFGYDPIFIPDGFDRTFAELPPEEKNEISHRGRAMKNLLAFISEKGL